MKFQKRVELTNESPSEPIVAINCVDLSSEANGSIIIKDLSHSTPTN